MEKTPAASTTSDCASELSKYDWPQDEAYNIMLKESGNNPSRLNNNPATGDYSIGCFQINLYGDLKQSRPSEASLYDPSVNVAFAYQMYVSQGRTFCKSSGWMNSCIKLGLR